MIQGYDAEHLVQRVNIENLRINGQVMSSLDEADFEKNEFTRNISIKPGACDTESGSGIRCL